MTIDRNNKATEFTPIKHEKGITKWYDKVNKCDTAWSIWFDAQTNLTEERQTFNRDYLYFSWAPDDETVAIVYLLIQTWIISLFWLMPEAFKPAFC